MQLYMKPSNSFSSVNALWLVYVILQCYRISVSCGGIVHVVVGQKQGNTDEAERGVLKRLCSM